MNEEDIKATFAAGIAILDPSGFYQRGDRKLELHLRHSVGLVAYHLGSVSLSHEDYMWAVMGKRGASSYPEFPQIRSTGSATCSAIWTNMVPHFLPFRMRSFSFSLTGLLNCGALRDAYR